MGKSTPDAPDYRGAAEETAASSARVTNQQTWANRPNVTTPWGSFAWDASSATDPSTGQPITQWNQNVSLTPESQSALDSQMRIQEGRSGLAEGLLGRANDEFGQPMDWSNLPDYGGVPTARSYETDVSMPDAIRNYTRQSPQDFENLDTSNLQGVDPSQRYVEGAGDAVYGQFSRRMEPRFEQDRSGLESRMYNQGLRPGDEAYDREMQRLGQDQGDARLNAMDQATLRSGEEASRMHGMDLATRGQQFGERGTAADFGMQASSQRFDQGLSANQQALGVAGMGYGMDESNVNRRMAAGGQEFGQEMQASNLATTLRQQALAEEMQRRGFSLNEINAILHGQQVSMPGQPSFMGANRSETTDYSGAASNQFQADMDRFSAKQAQTQMLIDAVGTFPV